MSTTIRDGDATVTITGDLEAWALAAIRSAAGGAVDVVRSQLEPLATQAEADWYGASGVQRVTGLSGDMAVVTVLDVGRGVARVSVGSTDTRPAGKRGARVPHFVRRPGRLSTAVRVVDRAGFLAVPKSTRIGRARKDLPKIGAKAGDYLVRVHNERASDGKMLLPVFVTGPVRLAVSAGLPAISAAMAVSMSATEVPRG